MSIGPSPCYALCVVLNRSLPREPSFKSSLLSLSLLTFRLQTSLIIFAPFFSRRELSCLPNERTRFASMTFQYIPFWPRSQDRDLLLEKRKKSSAKNVWERRQTGTTAKKVSLSFFRLVLTEAKRIVKNSWASLSSLFNTWHFLRLFSLPSFLPPLLAWANVCFSPHRCCSRMALPNAQDEQDKICCS